MNQSARAKAELRIKIKIMSIITVTTGRYILQYVEPFSELAKVGHFGVLTILSSIWVHIKAPR